ncbi:hypothetical protein EON65_15980 [archaeon]|nr:MAG: hypothetical protein EON65_15980 [archaeon]
MASWAGNLLIFLQYKSFPSDVVLAFCTADVSITLCNATGQTFIVKMPDFMQYSFNEFKSKGYFVVSFTISEHPAVSSLWGANNSETVMETFKIARREHNAHAFVDAGFQLLVQTSPNYAPTCVYARVVYGGIAPQIFIAGNVQQALLNKPLTAATLRDCVSALQLDWQFAGGVNAPLTSHDFTVSAAYACLYRIFLRAYPYGMLSASVRTALYPWVKPASRGVEVYPIDRQGAPLTPLHQAVPKLEAPTQSTGEAIYPSDEPLPANTLQGALIYATQSNCTLLGVDTNSLLKIPGVVAVLLAEDMLGANLTGTGVRVFVPKGEVVPYVGSCLGVVLADSSDVANQAVSMAKVSYGTPPYAPITNLSEAIQRQSFYPPDPSYCQVAQGDADGAMKTAPYVVRGRVEGGGQYHFYMENQCAVGTLEGGEKVELICGTQMPSGNQDTIAKNLSLPSSKVSCVVCSPV